MKLYIASVKDGNDIKIIKSEYPNKMDFAKDLRNNDYKVRFISTEETFDADSKKYNEKLLQSKNVQSDKRAFNKRHEL